MKKTQMETVSINCEVCGHTAVNDGIRDDCIRAIAAPLSRTEKILLAIML